MRYVESGRALRMVGLVAALGIIVVAATLVLQNIGVASGGSAISYKTFNAWRAELERRPGTTVTSGTGIGGIATSTVENAGEHVRVETSRRGRGLSIAIAVPLSESARFERMLNVVGTATYWSQREGIAYITNSPADEIDLRSIIGIVTVVGLIAATLLGGPLAKENEGHLALAWMRPTSRVRYALTVVGMDVVALVVCELVAAGCFLLVVAIYSTAGDVVDGGQYVWALPSAFLIPLTWYALLTAVSASLRRGLGIAVGVTWAVAFGVLMLGRMNQGWRVIQAINTLNPLHYLDDAGPSGMVRYAVALAVLTVVYVAAAVIQWRRAEL